ncbi:trigger factor [Kovacikia minuta CCNUW1]|uniref:trigger factor n=1 Tax=Kovacikia minuta TaxID=2931930 RepID=UPI001CC9DB42|nr:trigger factor [Kovacikia minuta]UBF28562.1 trigger factor [Kovacikia minuta CCNUW1]
MKVTQEKLPASQVGLQIEITPEMSKKAYEQVIQEYTRSANIPGFRKGKVPRQVLVQRIGSLRLKAAALEELIDDSLKQAIKQENIEALGNFQLISSFEELITQYEPGSALTFSASVDVQPEVTLDQYVDLHIQAEEIKLDPERVEKTLEKYQEQVATLVPVEDRPAQLKDITVVDYKGVLVSEEPDGEPEEFPGGEAEDFQVELAEGKFIEGFIDGIVGMAVGETKEIPIQFPEDYAPNLAGRSVIFTVTLKEIKEKELPELDDEFAQEVSEFETLADLRESLEKRYQEEADDRTAQNKEQAILNELIQHIQVELPESLIDRELNYMLNQTAVQLQNQGLDIRQFFNEETIPMLKQRSRPEAITRIKRTLALGEVAKKESVQVEPEEVNTKVNEILADLDDREIDRERLQSLVSEDLLKDKIVAWLLERSTVEMVPEGTLKKEPEVEAADAVEAAGIQDGLDAETDEPIDVEATEVIAPEIATPEDAAPEESAPSSEATEETAATVGLETATDADSTETTKKADGTAARKKSSKAKSKSSESD